MGSESKHLDNQNQSCPRPYVLPTTPSAGSFQSRNPVYHQQSVNRYNLENVLAIQSQRPRQFQFQLGISFKSTKFNVCYLNRSICRSIILVIQNPSLTIRMRKTQFNKSMDEVMDVMEVDNNICITHQVMLRTCKETFKITFM